MLIILLAFAFIRTLRGVPLASPSEPPDPFPVLTLRDTQSYFGQRTINEIVISCFATIFACTWSAVHPNIPAVTDSAWTCFKRQVTTTICALLAPELMTMWAMRQRLAAKRIRDEYNKEICGLLASDRITKGWFQALFDFICGVFQESRLPAPFKEGQGPQWTLAHGFFLQMGGFMLCEGGRPVQTLISSRSWDARVDVTPKVEIELLWNIRQGIIDPPIITKEAIKDRGKGDAISKTLIVLQTTWFVVQCIARWSQRLPVTELEIVTLGFAMFNGITYGLWWDKPQHVGQPVFLKSKKSRKDTSPTGTGVFEDAETESNPLLQSWLRRKLRQEIEEHAYSPSLLWRLPFRILQALGRPLMKMSGNSTVTKMRVGMFYTAELSEWEDGLYATTVPLAIAALFGAVHLIPSWFIHFSSPQEMWLWRFAAIVMTVGPASVLVTYLKFVSSYLKFLPLLFAPTTGLGLALYPIARIIIFTLSFTALHSLPPGALQTVEWTTFIPHL